MRNSKIRPAKKKDFDYFFKNEEVKYSAKAWVLIAKKDRIAIGGIWLMPTQFSSFVKTKDKIPKKTFWMASKLVTAKLQETGYPILCCRDTKQENSKKYLEKLGYKYFNTIDNQEIYKLWPQPLSL